MWILLVVALAGAFGHNFVEMWQRWFPAWRRTQLGLYDRFVLGQSYYTHGPIVPALSLLIAVLLVKHVKITVRPSRVLGGAVLAGSLLFHLVACLARVNFASGFALIGVLIGLVLWLWGIDALRQLWFPIAFLFFMVPLPEVTISNLNFKLKIFAADWGVRLTNAMGVIIERSGNRVFMEGEKMLVIANVCNGLRTLISLLAFGALYCYVCRLRGLWRIGLFLMTIPVAVVANSIRIVSLILVADIWSPEAATGAFHDWSGIFIFVLAFLMMFGIERFVLWAREAAGRPAEVLPLFHGRTLDPGAPPQWPAMAREVSQSRRGLIAGVTLALVAVGAWWLSLSVPAGVSEDALKTVWPKHLDVAGKPFHYHAEIEMGQKVRTVLENPGCLYWQYAGPDSRLIDYCLIFSRDNRKGTHPPDLCLAGSGEGIVGKGDLVLDGIAGGPGVPCREIIVQSDATKNYYLYTYKCGGRYTSSFWTQQLTIFANGLLSRNSSGALIRVSMRVEIGGGRGGNIQAAKTVEEARTMCAAMLRASIPHLNKNLP